MAAILDEGKRVLCDGLRGAGSSQGPMRGVAMGRVNRKATGDERTHATQVIQEAFPEYEVVWGSHGDYGGHRAPRDHTLSFRLRDRRGKYHSNVIWVYPGSLS